MKKAFTLIELLVVIAIIAILAAILFPVFAQAKSAAKKATSISNMKQFGSAVILYMGDNDDTYPRNDDCVDKSSLNPALNTRPFNPTGVGCSSGPFYYRVNHYGWQKWLMPYTKSVEVFFHPAMQKVKSNWDDAGEIMNGYALNLSITGALNTYGDVNRNGAFRDSFLGGTQSAIPDPSQAMLFTELRSTLINFMPIFTTPNANRQTAYPPAVRELWIPMFMKRIGTSGCNYSSEVDTTNYPFGGNIIVSRTDTSTKAMPIKQFLANTPSAAEYPVSGMWPCGPTGGSWTIGAAPTWNKSWPMWALER
ncbi:MAG TPA: prepilin-type N-terminal cleavage/methylation domain-containing protein [Fimbriimonadaceae bacterium]|nr:prepilin-type N-terminal cleavage/methylation domain-containing protein [Fimbriimonadaceae bacterium]HRJ97020.1 prepilin-type N-terminal cleavage/methylation domain-containing protein [Fimbriimonadaceae bacterium]